MNQKENILHIGLFPNVIPLRYLIMSNLLLTFSPEVKKRDSFICLFFIFVYTQFLRTSYDYIYILGINNQFITHIKMDERLTVSLQHEWDLRNPYIKGS